MTVVAASSSHRVTPPSRAEGDIRVLFALDLALSFLFSVTVVTLLDVAGINEFTWATVGVSTLFLAIVTYVVVLR